MVSFALFSFVEVKSFNDAFTIAKHDLNIFSEKQCVRTKILKYMSNDFLCFINKFYYIFKTQQNCSASHGSHN